MKTLDQVLKALGIESERKGKEYVACCPFHQDKTPSWGIAWTGRRKGLHHCWSCGVSGDLVGLVVHGLELKGDDARDKAKEWLRKRGHEDEKPPNVTEVRLVVPSFKRDPFVVPSEVLFAPLDAWPTPARRYAEKRHLTPGQVERWGIGYAVDGKLGGRLVLVVRDEEGVPVNYMARSFAKQEKRYLFPNTAERPRLDVLFGEEWWPTRRERTKIIVTEGALNALAAERCLGPGFAIGALGASSRTGSKGTLPSPAWLAQLAQLSTFPGVYVLTDPDKAGDAAAARIESGLARRCRVVRVRLPEGTDVDAADPNLVRDLVMKAA